MKLRTHSVAIILMAAMLSFQSCQKPEQTARDTIAVSKGVIQTAQAKYKEACLADATQAPCVTINKAIAAQNTAINALNLYCSGEGYQAGGACNPTKDALPKLEAALMELDAIIDQVEILIQ